MDYKFEDVVVGLWYDKKGARWALDSTNHNRMINLKHKE